MRRLIGLSMGAMLSAPMLADAQETRVGVVVAATGGYSNNPFAETGGDTGSAFGALDVTPQVRLLTERSTFTLSGQAHVQDYVRRYPVTDSYRASLDYRGRPSARLSTFAHVDLTSSVLGADDQYVVGNVTGLGGVVGGNTGIGTNPGTGTGATNPVGAGTGGLATGGLATGGVGTIPTSVNGPLLSDIGLLGTRDRRRSLYATAGGNNALGAHDTLSLTGFVEITRYSRFGDRSDYNGYGGTLGYSHQVSAYVNAGIQGSAASYDYRGLLGTTSVYSAQATASGRLSSRWTLNGALGVSFIDSNGSAATGAVGGVGFPGGVPGGERARNNTSLSGNIDLCRTDVRDTLCLQASRQARATGFNGAQYVTTGGVSWRHRLDERSSLLVDGTYLDQGGLANLNGFQNRYLRASATYDRQLRERLHLLVSGRYRKVYGGFAGQTGDYGGQVGVSYRFGDLR